MSNIHHLVSSMLACAWGMPVLNVHDVRDVHYVHDLLSQPGPLSGNCW